MAKNALKQLLDELLASSDENAVIGRGLSKEDLEINKQVIELFVNAGLLVLTVGTITGKSIYRAFLIE